MQLLSGINHVAIVTADLDRFTAFYTGVIGLTPVFEESVPGFRHAILAVGDHTVLHPVQAPADNETETGHGLGSPTIMDRGHLDHFALDVPSWEAFEELRRKLVAHGSSDGAVTDLGPKISFWFVDPDGMHVEIDWVHDRSLRGFHAPTPLSEERKRELSVLV
ncbi:VOC family protein [Pseudonocardia sp. TRM90224]|uniref:VOC family protein n=1 Tax=Pseudonocardia sp. TRM90224 TaxID=2812678 RepID=UPI001E369498|nr:VOC family protein [Pseudonocardia sp. TRM90224]